MVQRAQLVEDTMAKVEGMRGKDNSKPVFVKKGAPNIAPTFRNNNVNNNNKRPNVGRDVAGDKRVKMEDRQLSENCKFCDKPGHRAEECWKKLGACLRCGGRDHRIPNCPMMKDQPGRAQNAPRRQGRLNAIIEADLPEEGGMVEGTISIHSQPAFVLIDTGAAYSFISTTFAATLPVKPVPLKSKISVASPLGSESELTHYLPKCETIIGGHNLPADLICLDMKGYDAILGVDWLIEYDADVNCRHRRGRVEEFLAAGEAGDPHTKPFFFPVVSAATCTDHHLEVDQRLHLTYMCCSGRASSVDTTWTSVDTLSQNSSEGVIGRSLVSTLLDLVSTLPDQFCPKDANRTQRVSKGSNLTPMTASHRYTVNHGCVFVTPRPPWAVGPVLWVAAGRLSRRGSDRVGVWFCLGLRHGVCRLLEGDMAYVAFPSRRPRRSLTDMTGVLCVSTALAVSGERDKMAVAFTFSNSEI
ncbi:hypothetical protein Taro_001788 [Colocasia esculenta]|uniref:CCHC-type domain-containing protein n=1 Tax=Colocasia esculenta TaxID=4460 RepID=A0A843TJ17_COLES|nr:hypothetical protein [Colocasia esculenta]